MKAILLAAGVGRRLGRDKPKALLEVGGRTLLERHLENLRAASVGIRVVTGFAAAQMAPFLRDVDVVFNPDFERGSLLSLQAGLRGIAEDVVVMDADVLYDPSILQDVLALERGFAIDLSVTPGSDGEMMMIGVRDGRACAIRRGLRDGYDQIGEGVGFFAVDQGMVGALDTAIDACDPDGDYEAALDRLVSEFGADFVPVDGRAWTEIDFPEDLERAETEVLVRL